MWVRIEDNPMRYMTAVPATIVAAFLMLSASGYAQAPKEGSTLTIAGNSGEARLLQINGKAYVEVESLARLTKGTLSFQATRTILTLPAADSQAPVATPPVKVVFTRAFVQAGIEEMGSIREWRIVIVRAVQNNVPVSPEWITAQHTLAEKNLAFASAAISTDDDRNAFALLKTQLTNMQMLSDLYLAMVTRSTAMSPDTFDNAPLEEQILSCARDFVAMTESREYQDQQSCH